MIAGTGVALVQRMQKPRTPAYFEEPVPDPSDGDVERGAGAQRQQHLPAGLDGGKSRTSGTGRPSPRQNRRNSGRSAQKRRRTSGRRAERARTKRSAAPR